jgi:hypothetical protein
MLRVWVAIAQVSIAHSRVGRWTTYFYRLPFSHRCCQFIGLAARAAAHGCVVILPSGDLLSFLRAATVRDRFERRNRGTPLRLDSCCCGSLT